MGKSSLTGVLRRELDDLGIVIDVDQLTAAQGGDPFAGGKAAIRKIENCLKKGICFTQETTLSGGRTERTVQKAKEAGYQIRLYYVGLGSATGLPKADMIFLRKMYFGGLTIALPM